MLGRLFLCCLVSLVSAHAENVHGGDDLGMVQTQFTSPGDDCLELAERRGERVFQETGDLHKVREEVAKFTMECRRGRDVSLAKQAQVMAARTLQSRLHQDPEEYDEASHAQETAKAKKVEAAASNALAVARTLSYDSAVADAIAARKRLEVAKTLANAERLDAEADRQEAEGQQNMTEGLQPLMAIRIKAYEASVEAMELALKAARQARRECKEQEKITDEAQAQQWEAKKSSEASQAKAEFERNKAKDAAQEANEFRDMPSDDPYLTSTQNTLEMRTQMTEQQTMDALASKNAAASAANIASTMQKQLEIVCSVADAKEAKAKLANQTVSTEEENLQVFQSKIKEAARETKRKWEEFEAQRDIARQQERYVASNESAVAAADLLVQKAKRVSGAANMTAVTREDEVVETQQKAQDVAGS